MVDLDGGPLTLQAVEAVARRGEQVSLAPGAEQALRAGRAFVDRLAAGAEPIYGITTGVGKLKDVVIPPGERADLQRNLVLSHAGGVGAPLAEADVRAIMLLLAASLARGASGVRPAVVETVIACLNRRVHPVVPELGSVGASGDLAPLAHVALCLLGEGSASDGDRQIPAAEALARAGVSPLVLETKEGLALLNGTHLMAGHGALTVLDAACLTRLADVAGAMSLEALMGSNAAFDSRIHALRPHPGQLAAAANLVRLTAESGIIASHRDCTRVQDAYSLRCMPQVHGSTREAVTFARSVIERELASVSAIPPAGLQEDSNSMAAGSALKARRAAGLARQVLAIELLLAAQALDFRAPLPPGRGSSAARDAVRRRIPPLDRDRYLKADLDAALGLCEAGTVLAAVEAAIGPLE